MCLPMAFFPSNTYVCAVKVTTNKTCKERIYKKKKKSNKTERNTRKMNVYIHIVHTFYIRWKWMCRINNSRIDRKYCSTIHPPIHPMWVRQVDEMGTFTVCLHTYAHTFVAYHHMYIHYMPSFSFFMYKKKNRPRCSMFT